MNLTRYEKTRLARANSFIERSAIVHNNKFDYSSVDYNGTHKPVTIICPDHGPFSQRPVKHLSGLGCSKCSGSYSPDTSEFIDMCRKVHGDVYDYSRVQYTRSGAVVTIGCPIHGPFEQIASSHAKGHGCSICAGKRSNAHEFATKASLVHDNKYSYDLVEYTTNSVCVTIVCPDHGPFEQTPNSHLAGNGCSKCSCSGVSAMESNLFDYVKSISSSAVQSDRTVLGPKELDIYDNVHKVAIEFDGIYWHSSSSTESDRAMSKKHSFKTEECIARGIRLFHIFENEWNEKQSIWKSVISNALGRSSRIYARKCTVRAVDSKTAKLFCELNHLQGSSTFATAVGLYHNNELVSLMTFGKARYSKADHELLRFCNKLNTTVVGGASKMIKFYRKNHPGSIVSYANKRWSIGNLYEAIGFEHIHDSDPCYWYFKINENVMYHRSSFMKHKLKDKLDIFDPNLTEVDNMYANGYRRIWDSGNKVYLLR